MTAEQQMLFAQEGVKALGGVGGEHSKAQLLLINGRSPGHYVAKRYLPEYPYMMATEVVCADLASRLGLPIPSRRQIDYDGNTWLGFHWLPEDYKPLVGEKLGKLANPEVIPSILAFDVFICNWDRKDENMVLQKVSPTIDMYQLFIIDHSAALCGVYQSIDAWLRTNKATERYLTVPTELLGRVKSWEDFEPFLSKLEDLRAEEVSAIVDSVPEFWRPRYNDKTHLLSGFLARRAHEVRDLLLRARDCFPSIHT